MVKPLLFASLLFINLFAAVAQQQATPRQVIVPANAAKPVGPYSPGVSAGEYLYVSGQGVRDAQNNVPVGVAAQAKQCLENVKAIVEAGGLTLEHVVHMQLYLERLSDLPEVERVYASYFPNNPPARVVLGTAKMPTDTPIEMTVVAVRDLKAKRVLKLKSLSPLGHASAAIAVGNRIYLSGLYGATPAAVQQKLQRALAEVKAVAVWRNEYGTKISAPIAMNELPEGAQAGLSVIALRSAAAKPATAKNGATEACVADGSTIFCQVQAACACDDLDLPGEVRFVFKQLETGLAKHGATLAHAVASNVYLNDIGEFRPMNETYATFFSAAPPTRTTVQAFAKTARTAAGPPFVRIGLIAVKD